VTPHISPAELERLIALFVERNGREPTPGEVRKIARGEHSLNEAPYHDGHAVNDESDISPGLSQIRSVGQCRTLGT
jgi:hypothetical protein